MAYGKGVVHVICMCFETVAGIVSFVVNAFVRFCLNTGNPGPTVVMIIPIQYLKSAKRVLLAS